MSAATRLALLTLYASVFMDDVTTFKTRRELRVNCNEGDSLVQVSAYEQAYFNTSSTLSMMESLQSSPIFCMWKQGCRLKMIKRNNKPKKLWFRDNMRCLKNETQVYDLIPTNISQNTQVETLNQTVVVRSHKGFPWNYALCDEASTYVLKFKTDEKLLGKFKVVLQILFLDLDRKYDSLYLKLGSTTRNIKEGQGRVEMPITNLNYLQLEFESFRPRNMMGCMTSSYKGFLLCMKFVESTQDGGRICEEVMGDVAVKMWKRKAKKQKRMRKLRGKKIRSKSHG